MLLCGTETLIKNSLLASNDFFPAFLVVAPRAFFSPAHEFMTLDVCKHFNISLSFPSREGTNGKWVLRAFVHYRLRAPFAVMLALKWKSLRRELLASAQEVIFPFKYFFFRSEQFPIISFENAPAEGSR